MFNVDKLNAEVAKQNWDQVLLIIQNCCYKFLIKDVKIG